MRFGKGGEEAFIGTQPTQNSAEPLFPMYSRRLLSPSRLSREYLSRLIFERKAWDTFACQCFENYRGETRVIFMLIFNRNLFGTCWALKNGLTFQPKFG